MLDPLGVVVNETPGLATPGASQSSGGVRRVWLRKDDDVRRRRFTLCHELGHLLLRDAGQEEALSVASVERLCDEFGSLLLIDRQALALQLADGFDWAPVSVLALCRVWKSSLTPMILALERATGANGRVVLIASKRVNPRTGVDPGYRVDAAAGGSLFLPRNQRLSSLGLTELASWCEDRAGGKRGDGCDKTAQIVVLRRKEGEGAFLCGPVRWAAARLVHGVLAVLDVSAMMQPMK
ncbi:MAG: hypothetical protein CVU63_23010 [Deltaproteobacteria bacterium HGW-Deltaproteobacteria-20]|nr:MAG: hypothetical protein CVU63_23010 [Deltaproteobacteria bacterium HGW-Deltaproteobacteria-20]